MKKEQVNEAWEIFFESRKVVAIDDLTADGWIIGEEVARKIGVSPKHLADSGALERKRARVLISGQARVRSFYRPKAISAAK